MARVTKYKTRLTEDGKVALEKELSVNCPEIERKLTSPDKVDRLARDFLRMHEEPEEHVYMLCLNNRNVLTAVMDISYGTVNSSLLHPREVFQKALLANAVSIILMHNHPSGDANPSKEDIDTTKRIAEAGKVVGVEVLDHIVIGRYFFSLKANGLM